MLPVEAKEDRSTRQGQPGPDSQQSNYGTNWHGSSWSRSAPDPFNGHSRNWRTGTRYDGNSGGSTDTRGTTGMPLRSTRRHWRHIDHAPSQATTSRHDHDRAVKTKRQRRRFRFYPLLLLKLISLKPRPKTNSHNGKRPIWMRWQPAWQRDHRNSAQSRE